MNRVRCFFLKPAGLTRVSLRRYASSDTSKCSGKLSYHNAHIQIAEILSGTEYKPTPGHSDPRWPRKCDHCDYRFVAEDSYQLHQETLYLREDNADVVTLRSAPPGAMWWADWYADRLGIKGPDGKCLVVKLPNGRDWIVDSQASNCTRRGEPHQCWVRHGEPPNVTVDKSGDTCSAGAGSILAGDYHGFLRNGWLES